ncbi:MAG TPA: hypothetical protein VHQ90_11235 [Thermoanaerobaculia bacterium]|nr:hypothetical protein [Thermoanaerobaculia bacterium]
MSKDETTGQVVWNHAVDVGQGEGWQLQLGGPLDQVLGQRGAVEEREGRRRMQLGVGRMRRSHGGLRVGENRT